MNSHQINSKKSLEQYVVGLTGGICSGKSKAAEYFQELGAYVIDLDKVVHEVYKKNFLLKYKLYKEFGLEIFNKNLEVDRKKLGKIVFSDDSKLKQLENIVWPYVEKKREKKTKNKKGIIIIEASMLYESGLETKFDNTILVLTSEELQVKRLMERNNLGEREAKEMIRLQTSRMSQRDKLKKCDYIIINNDDLNFLKNNVERIWDILNVNFLKKKHLSTVG